MPLSSPEEENVKPNVWKKSSENRQSFVGGSDARIIMGNDEAALVRLWRQKRGELEPEDLSGSLVVQLGVATEDLNRRWLKCTPPGGRRSGRQIDHPPGVLLFELGRAPVSKRGMEPLAVVDLLDEAGQ